jgi:hypothetical protein
MKVIKGTPMSRLQTPQLTSKDGNMIVDFYPIKTPYGDISQEWYLKVLTFKAAGNQMSKKCLNRIEMLLEIRERVAMGYTETRDNSNLPQLANPMYGAC